MLLIFMMERIGEVVPADFPENPKKYAPYPYNENALTVMRMDGTKLEI
jgi:hypothetical protein